MQLTNGEPTRTSASRPVTVRAARPDDAPGLWRLARDSGGLDLNSPYAYALAGHHFGATSVVADTGGELVGFVVAYQPPSAPDEVFIWQVTVADSHRGAGLARRLIHEVAARGAARGATRLTASVTPSNQASRRLFAAVATDLDATVEEAPWIPIHHFPTEAGEHEPEHLLVIAPLSPPRAPTTTRPRREGTP